MGMSLKDLIGEEERYEEEQVVVPHGCKSCITNSKEAIIACIRSYNKHDPEWNGLCAFQDGDKQVIVG